MISSENVLACIYIYFYCVTFLFFWFAISIDDKLPFGKIKSFIFQHISMLKLQAVSYAFSSWGFFFFFSLAKVDLKDLILALISYSMAKLRDFELIKRSDLLT